MPVDSNPPSVPAPAERVTENRAFVTVDGVPRYRIGAGDLLEVFLTRGLIQDRQTVPVRASGKITVVLRDVTVTGLSAEQAADEIQRVLRPLYRELSVEVVVKEHHASKVSILGAVGKPGTYPLEGRTALLDLLAKVGGPVAGADLQRVRVLRPDRRLDTVDLLGLILNYDSPREVVLDAGDVVFIAGRDASVEEQVFVLGEVANPGAFTLRPNMRLSHALALAKGTTNVAVVESARIIRGGPREPKLLVADFRRVLEHGDLSEDVSLQANDLIVVPRQPIGDWNAFLAKIRPTIETLFLIATPALLFGR